MKRPTVRGVLGAISSFMLFFVTVGFVVSCCTMLFISVLAQTTGLALTSENIAAAAKVTFWNVVLITFLFKLIDHIRRKIMVERPTRIIIKAAERMMQGDFSVRIPPMQGSGMEGFDQIAESINRMAQELQSVEALRSDFIANVSHEMKTPLAVMHNYGTLLQAPDLSEQRRLEYAKGVTDASRRMAEMVTNVLRLNRLEHQQIFPEATVFDLGEQLCACLLPFERVWEGKDIDIETDIAPDVTVKADAELLSLVWNNLFSNAFKFTPQGGRVTVQLSATAHHATVTVRDTGCGMSAEVGAHIFEKFYQGDPSRAVQGNGLGLALVRRVVDILHGEISVQSAVGVGTTFTVRIGR